nr:hypothetical protein Q903MT_gene3681 [Picea sitchensis]
MRNTGYPLSYPLIEMRAEEIQSFKYWLFTYTGYPLSEMRAGEIPSKDIHIQSVVHPSSKQQPMLLCWLFGSTASIQINIYIK